MSLNILGPHKNGSSQVKGGIKFVYIV